MSYPIIALAALSLSDAVAAPDFTLGEIQECTTASSDIAWVEVKNVGTTSSSAWIDLFVGRALPPAIGEWGDYYQTTGTLGAHESAWYSFGPLLPAFGGAWIDVILDTDQFVAESNEANNTGYIWGDFATCEPRVTMLAAGLRQTCALLEDGSVQCWGNGEYGVLGYSNVTSIGDNEHPYVAGDVPLGANALQIEAGYYHTCAIVTGGVVRCWGRGNYGQLGYANTNNIGDNELPSTAGNVNVGGTVTQLAAGAYHTCALLTTGTVRCWGQGLFGQLGYGNTNNIGDNETPSTAGNVSLGGTAVAIEAGEFHTCALLNTGAVRCWGAGSQGQLGYANTNTIGDNETPSTAGDVNVGGTVASLDLGSAHTCAVLSTGAVRCWGEGDRLGYGTATTIGDTETPSTAGNVPTGFTTSAIAAGGEHTCALSSTGKVRCWGYVVSGGLGYASTLPVSRPDTAGDVRVGGTVDQLVAGYSQICALLDSGAVRCWGDGGGGVLGYANTADIGDNETPAWPGNISIF